MVELWPDDCEDGGKRDELALIRQVDDAVGMVLPQESGSRLEPFLDRGAVFQIGFERQAQERLACGPDGGELRLLTPRGDLRLAFLGTVQKRDGLQDIGRGDLFQDAEFLFCRAAVKLQASLQPRLSLCAKPVIPQAVAAGGIHGSDELEGI